MNHLYFGDCLDILLELDREHNGKGFIDIIYIDPPFNSKRNYNVLFESIDLKDATAQKQPLQIPGVITNTSIPSIKFLPLIKTCIIFFRH